MAAFEWRTVRGYAFTPEEAGEASDFIEVLRNYSLDPVAAYELFKMEGKLTVAKRLVFAEAIDLDNATILLLCDPDERVRGVVEKRLEEHREKESGGIITTG
mgnify:CR=1 FL=1